MPEEEIFFNLIFIILFFAVIYPPKEFESAGKFKIKKSKFEYVEINFITFFKASPSRKYFQNTLAQNLFSSFNTILIARA
jgi:hypothetical protein